MPHSRRTEDPDAVPQSATSGKKLKHNLAALSSAAVLAVYAAGYFRTRAAAERFAHEALSPRPAGPSFLRPGSVPPTLRPAETTPGEPASRSPGPAAEPKPTPAPRSTEAVTSSDEAPTASSLPTSMPPAAAPAEPRVSEVAAAPVEAPAPAPAAPVPAAVVRPTPHYKDGTFKGWGSCRHGDIEATVTVTGGRIVSAVVSQCWTRWSCSVVAPLLPQVAARQSAEVDYVSGATQSTYAFYYAVLEALAKAK